MEKILDKILEDYLFNDKRVLVAYGDKANNFETVVTLMKGYAIKIPYNKMEMLGDSVLQTVKRNIPYKLTGAFYQGFPQTVHNLVKSQIVFDQLYHYYQTYGEGDFSNSGKSMFEGAIERIAFKGKTEVKEFDVISYEDAVKLLDEVVLDFCTSTRPLNARNLDVVHKYYQTFKKPLVFSGKTNLVKTVYTFRNKHFISQLYLSDVYKIVDHVANLENKKHYFCRDKYTADNVRLNAKDRKFITKIIDKAFTSNRSDVKNCYEKRAFWCGILHQIHYKPKTELAKTFCDDIRSKKAKSCYSLLNKLLEEGNVVDGAKLLIKEKGASALIRNIDYIISRARTSEDVKKVVALIDISSPMVAIQLISKSSYEPVNGRDFFFSKNNLTKHHKETEDEIARRKTALSADIRKQIIDVLLDRLAKHLNGKFGKVYIDEKFKKIALPVYDSDTNAGFNTLSKGSRVAIDKQNIFRAFIYWEKVDDVDLSCFGISKDGKVLEFSWRTTGRYQTNKAITYSGDQTSGYNGGSEFLDVYYDRFTKNHPACDYVVFCANAYTPKNFDQFTCRAGYMTRDNAYIGNIYEPKTVSTAFPITAQSTYAILFALDIKNCELVWLNLSRSDNYACAGNDNINSVRVYLELCKTLNVYKFFELSGAEFVSSASDADYVVSDEVSSVNDNQSLIRSYDLSKLIPFINGKA